MSLILTPELGIPFAKFTDPAALKGYRAKAEALINTLHFLEAHEALPDGATEPTPEDAALARQAFATQALDPAKQTPASVRHLEALLSEYDHELVDVHVRLRAYVTNRLLAESDNFDAKIRLRALELLGKVTDVGLFTERVEVVRRGMSPEEIEQELQDRFDKLMARTVVATQTPEESRAAPATLLDVDLDAVL